MCPLAGHLHLPVRGVASSAVAPREPTKVPAAYPQPGGSGPARGVGLWTGLERAERGSASWRVVDHPLVMALGVVRSAAVSEPRAHRWTRSSELERPPMTLPLTEPSGVGSGLEPQHCQCAPAGGTDVPWAIHRDLDGTRGADRETEVLLGGLGARDRPLGPAARSAAHPDLARRQTAAFRDDQIATNVNRHQLGSNSYPPHTPTTVSRLPATGALLIATEAKAPSKLQRSGPPQTLASRVTRDGTTSCRCAAWRGAPGRSRTAG